MANTTDCTRDHQGTTGGYAGVGERDTLGRSRSHGHVNLFRHRVAAVPELSSSDFGPALEQSLGSGAGLSAAFPAAPRSGGRSSPSTGLRFSPASPGSPTASFLSTTRSTATPASRPTWPRHPSERYPHEYHHPHARNTPGQRARLGLHGYEPVLRSYGPTVRRTGTSPSPPSTAPSNSG